MRDLVTHIRNKAGKRNH